MPELPEVEYARRQLQRWASGAVVERVVVRDGRVVAAGQSKKIDALLRGRTVRRVERRGKRLRFVLDRGFLFSHLGMTGKWVREDEAPRFERVRVELRRRGKVSAISFVDPRKFGKLQHATEDIAAWRALGPDPLLDGIDVARLHEKLARRSRPVKPVLLDQKLLAGVGNIQAIEALFLARIDPRRKAASLTKREVGALARGIDRSIRRTLEAETGAEITYVEEAGAENPFLIYGRGGEPCPRCKTKLLRIEQAGRGTVYCGNCQR